MKSKRAPGLMVSIDGTSLKRLTVIFVIGITTMLLLTGILTSVKAPYRVSSSSLNDLTTQFTGKSLLYLLGFENAYFTTSLRGDHQVPRISAILFELATSFNPDDPRSLLGNELPGFAAFDGEIIVAGEGTNYTNMPIESSVPLEVLLKEREASVESITPEPDEPKGQPLMTTNGRDVVYIYATHTREAYLPHLNTTDENEAFHSTVNVGLVSKRLEEELEERGIGALSEEKDIIEILNNKGWKYHKAYDASREVVKSVQSSHKDLTFFFDIHRDTQRKSVTTATINGKSYARTMFVIGGEHANYEKNLKMATELHHMLDERYPGLSRGILKKQGSGTNGKFNQDLSEQAILIEFGGVDNNLEEVYLTAEAVADVFADYYWKSEKASR